MEKKEIDLEDLDKGKEKQKGRLAKYSGVIALVFIIVFFIILALSGINIGSGFAKLAWDYYATFGEWGIYLGVFVLCLIGNATVIFPVPYTVVIIIISAVLGIHQPWYFPLVIGLFAGAGASVGETTAWFVGRGAREWARFKESEKVKRMKKWVDNGRAPLMIFIFALTPLADDPFLMVLGFVGYALWRAILWCVIGKWAMCFIISGLSIWASGTSWGLALIKLFGIDLEAFQATYVEGTVPELPPPTNEEVISSTIVWILTFVVVIGLIYVDWGKLGEKLSSWGKKRKGAFYPPVTPDPDVTVQKDAATESQVPKDPKNPTT